MTENALTLKQRFGRWLFPRLPVTRVLFDQLRFEANAWMDFVNHVFHQWAEHRWAYDFEMLVDRLGAAGFAAVERASFGSSRCPALAQDRPVHAPSSLYVDAVKDARP